MFKAVSLLVFFCEVDFRRGDFRKRNLSIVCILSERGVIGALTWVGSVFVDDDVLGSVFFLRGVVCRVREINDCLGVLLFDPRFGGWRGRVTFG